MTHTWLFSHGHNLNNPPLGVPLCPLVLQRKSYAAEATSGLCWAIAAQMQYVQILQKYESASLSLNGGSS